MTAQSGSHAEYRCMTAERKPARSGRYTSTSAAPTIGETTDQADATSGALHIESGKCEGLKLRRHRQLRSVAGNLSEPPAARTQYFQWAGNAVPSL